jgi:MFS family permease
MGKKYYFLYTKALSEVGNMMEMMVMNAVIFSLTRSTTWLAAELASRVMGGIVSSLFSGILADRYNRRRLMIYSDIVRGLFVLILCLFPSPMMFIVIAFALGAFGSFFQVSFSAEIPQIFGEERILEMNAFISRLSAISMVIGFLISACLSNLVNYRVIILLDSISFFLSAFVLVYYKWENLEKESGIPSWKLLITDVKDVKAYLTNNRLLFFIFIVFLFQTFAASSQNVGIPLLSEELSQDHLAFYQGIIWGVWGLGSVLSTWVIPKIMWLKRNLHFVYLGFSLLASAGFILLLSNKIVGLILLFSFLTGMFDAGSSTYFSTIVQQTENAIRGRIFGVANLLRGIGFTIGFVAATIFLKLVDMPHLVWIFHGLMIGIIVIVSLYLSAKKSTYLQQYSDV